ncbi:unnamed protein product [Anisakis simplex]|uniref:Uncharacterized protein n=1 Tax=Anisakis simplex TaxID=6269 RepID=A0A3P6PC85_ANISI|nr:unnamed protein product [Anisakis simplex]
MHHEDELNGVEKEINEVVEDVRVGCAQQLELRSNFNLILKELHEQVKGWQTMLDDLESAEAGEK